MNLQSFFSVNYTDTPLQIFGSKHLIVVAIFVLVWLSFVYFRKTWNDKQKNTIRIALAIFLAVNEIGLHIWSAYWGIWNIQTMLPLHMCSVMVWVTTYTALTDNRTLYDFTYFLGIGGALQAFLTPVDVAMYDLPHYRSLQSLIAHGLLITIPIFMTVVEGYRPTFASFKRIFIWTNIYMVIIFFLNRVIGSNYLFIAQKPPSPTLMDMLSPWPWYIPQLEVVAFIIFFILYIPFLIKDQRAKQSVRQA
ncbi:MAG TPA: TIGR02206 family membrane protein [Anaerolineales bacterium]|nr:TIGR02206 family membrane protein [Anaerolineales bacterium]HNE05079.1 TIGR02206 family membrane protein [Anaerolineales bacterium]HNF94809.1 TIGR02206 family membrane protein [Anaerolineales bacterium]HNM36095.1 TIGR02206 family membrane protein [Anaerolineales bacterium]